MASARTQRLFATSLSILGHAAIVAALTFSIPLSSSRPVQPEAVMINTKMIDEGAVQAEMARIEAELEAVEREREEEADRIRLEREREQERLAAERRAADEARVAREQEEARLEDQRREAEAETRRLQREAAEEADRLADLEQQRVAREQAAEEERLRQQELERQAELARQEAARIEQERLAEIARQEELARQEAARIEQARLDRIARIEAEAALAVDRENARIEARNAGLLDQWILAIEDKIERTWIRPPNATDELNCLLLVNLIPSGEVISVRVEECNIQDATIIRSIENGVLQASPLPPPPDPSLFERNLLVRFQPGFRPDD